MPYLNPELQKQKQHESYKRNRARILEKQRALRIELRKWLQDIKQRAGCLNCGENHPVCLAFHHLDPSIKDETVSNVLSTYKNKDRAMAEMAKCIILCHNCHDKLHYYLDHPEEN